MAHRKSKAVFLACIVAMLGGSFAQAQDSRSIGRLFFENDQRRILESIRQGLLDDDEISDLNVEPIQVPLPQFETEEIGDVITDEQTGEVIRPRSYTLGGYIRAHSSERVRFAVQGGILDSGNEAVFRKLGLKLQVSENGRIRTCGRAHRGRLQCFARFRNQAARRSWNIRSGRQGKAHYRKTLSLAGRRPTFRCAFLHAK